MTQPDKEWHVEGWPGPWLGANAGPPGAHSPTFAQVARAKIFAESPEAEKNVWIFWLKLAEWFCMCVVEVQCDGWRVDSFEPALQFWGDIHEIVIHDDSASDGVDASVASWESSGSGTQWSSHHKHLEQRRGRDAWVCLLDSSRRVDDYCVSVLYAYIHWSFYLNIYM